MDKPLDAQVYNLEINKKMIEVFVSRVLPEIKRFFADENIRLEFEEWQKKQREY